MTGLVKGDFSLFINTVLSKHFPSSVLNKIQDSALSVCSQSHRSHVMVSYAVIGKLKSLPSVY